MNIHEYQAKDILRAEGVPIPAGEVASTPEQVEAVATKIGGMVVVKAGTLDDPAPFVPGVSVWTSSALPWVQLPEGQHTFERNA